MAFVQSRIQHPDISMYHFFEIFGYSTVVYHNTSYLKGNQTEEEHKSKAVEHLLTYIAVCNKNLETGDLAWRDYLRLGKLYAKEAEKPKLGISLSQVELLLLSAKYITLAETMEKAEEAARV